MDYLTEAGLRNQGWTISVVLAYVIKAGLHQEGGYTTSLRLDYFMGLDTLLRVMPKQLVRHIYFSIAVLVIITCASSVTASSTLCERRCEASIPQLQNFRTLWYRLSIQLRTLGKPRVSFESFLKSLVFASERRNKLRSFRSAVMKMVSMYQGCTKACGHRYRKRSTQSSNGFRDGGSN
ncbi:uncharacterized protein [Argopecten irradians]|uniref:uncharacterized protein n=1 Tax=Argopecten irradians TaxID=31199 RepID=UPI003715AC6C